MAGGSSRTRTATASGSSAATASTTTKRFAGITRAITKLSARTLALDGEIAIYDQELRLALRVVAGAGPRRRRHAAAVHGADLLYGDGRDLTACPLGDRRARLEDVVAGSNLVFSVRRLSPDGLEKAWRQVVERR